MASTNTNRIKDKISICALAYNHINYLDDFFKGVLNQQLEDCIVEIIIGVDKGDDQTLEKCLEVQRQFPDLIKLIIHPERIGMMKNFVSVLGKADGEYIAFCECDDYWIDDNKLSAQIDLLKHFPNAGICFTDIKILKTETVAFEKNWATIEKKEYSLTDILVNNVISNCTVLMRNNIDDAILNQLLQFEVGDWPLYILSMYKDNCIAVYLNKITTIYRHHDRGFHSTKNTIDRLKITNTVYESLLKIISSPKFLKCINKQMTKNFYSMGVFQQNTSEAFTNYRISAKQISFSNLKFPLLSSLRILQSFFYTKKDCN